MKNSTKAFLAKTNFNTTTVGKAIIRYYDALEGVITDQNARFKAAINQAQKLDGVTPDQVLATFDQLQATLDTDAQTSRGMPSTTRRLRSRLVKPRLPACNSRLNPSTSRSHSCQRN